MTAARRARRSLAGLLVLSVACTGSTRGAPTGPPGGSPRAPRCEVRFTPPSGFEVTRTREEPAPDHVGVRVDLRDDRGRHLHVFAGIEGEFGEGAPVAGRVRLATGEEVRLLGAGETWILFWESSGPCATHAVIGNGFAREEFLRAMEEAGVVAG